MEIKTVERVIPRVVREDIANISSDFKVGWRARRAYYAGIKSRPTLKHDVYALGKGVEGVCKTLYKNKNLVSGTIYAASLVLPGGLICGPIALTLKHCAKKLLKTRI